MFAIVIARLFDWLCVIDFFRNWLLSRSLSSLIELYSGSFYLHYFFSVIRVDRNYKPNLFLRLSWLVSLVFFSERSCWKKELRTFQLDSFFSFVIQCNFKWICVTPYHPTMSRQSIWFQGWISLLIANFWSFHSFQDL